MRANGPAFPIKNPPSEELKFWRDIPASKLSITDIDYYDGHIYVAGYL